MKYIWVGEYLSNRKWHYIGADPNVEKAQTLTQEFYFLNRDKVESDRIRVRRYEYVKDKSS